MPVPLIKRGANQAGYPEKNLPAGPPSQGAVSGPDKPCRMIPFRRTPGADGGGWAGNVLASTNLPGPPLHPAVSGPGQALQGDTIPQDTGSREGGW